MESAIVCFFKEKEHVMTYYHQSNGSMTGVGQYLQNYVYDMEFVKGMKNYTEDCVTVDGDYIANAYYDAYKKHVSADVYRCPFEDIDTPHYYAVVYNNDNKISIQFERNCTDSFTARFNGEMLTNYRIY